MKTLLYILLGIVIAYAGLFLWATVYAKLTTITGVIYEDETGRVAQAIDGTECSQTTATGTGPCVEVGMTASVEGRFEYATTTDTVFIWTNYGKIFINGVQR